MDAKLEAAQQHHDDAAVKDLQTSIDAAGKEIEKLRRSAADALPPTQIQVECGLALDCEGNEIIVPRPHQFDPWQLLSEADRRRVSGNPWHRPLSLDLLLRAACRPDAAGDAERLRKHARVQPGQAA